MIPETEPKMASKKSSGGPTKLSAASCALVEMTKRLMMLNVVATLAEQTRRDMVMMIGKVKIPRGLEFPATIIKPPHQKKN